MKKLIFLVYLVLFSLLAFSQACLINGYTFNSQSDIDNFQSNYPNCTWIRGPVTISGANITNLNGLSVLTKIFSLKIEENDLLNDLSGLNNLTDIERELEISNNNSLTGLTGINNLTLIGEDVIINNNPSLTSLMGMESLTSIDGNYLQISDNSSLTNLTGLNNITTIKSSVNIENNPSLTSISALNNLTYIGNSLEIGWNSSLLSLTGLEGLTSLVHIQINSNSSLINFKGLDNLDKIESNLLVDKNGSLINFSGLDNLTSIGGYLRIYFNFSLKNLMGLQNLTSTGQIYIYQNFSLNNIKGFEKLTSINGTLTIGYNDSLTSLEGLDNVESNAISRLQIWHNSSLSTCDVKSICDYLASPIGTISIHDNATGCNNQLEVEESCASSLIEIYNKYHLAIHPNPFYTSTTIEYELSQPKTVTIIFYNQFGKQVDVIEQKQSIGVQRVIWIPRNLADGIYYFRLQAGEQVATGKMVLMR